MKKIALYSIAAFVLGLFLIVGPLFVLATFGKESTAVSDFLRSEGLQTLEKGAYGYSQAYSYSSLDVGVLALCFFVALTVYLLFKRMV